MICIWSTLFYAGTSQIFCRAASTFEKTEQNRADGLRKRAAFAFVVVSASGSLGDIALRL
jgi:hypothetical protein